MTRNDSLLLVGGAGYIGSVMSGQFLSAGWNVRCFDQLIYKNESSIWPYFSRPEYEFIRGDVRDSAACKQALDGVRCVVILAGLVGDPITRKYPSESESINLRGIRNFIDVLDYGDVERVIFVSTCSNYGLVEGNVAVDEQSELAPLSLYAQHKVQIEEDILGRRGKVGYVPTVLRFATAFGVSPRMRFDLTVNEFVRDLYLGAELLVFDAQTWRPYCHVRDFSNAVQRVLQAPEAEVGFEIFNVGSDQNNYTKQMIVDQIRSILPDVRIRYQERGPDPRNYRVNFNKLRQTLGWCPEVTVQCGVVEILNACRLGLFDHVEEQPNFFGNREIFCVPEIAEQVA